MAITKVSSTQTKNEGLPRILYIRFNNGTGTRSTKGAGAIAALPGATGDTSYTAPSDTDVDILFTMTQMINPVGGTCQVYLSINGAQVNPGTYQEAAGPAWHVHTVQYKVQVNAGQTITIGALWVMSAGTATATNASGDSAFPNQIHGIVIPRNT